MIFTEEQIANLTVFGKTLEKIHRRLIASGYIIKDGKFIPPEQKPQHSADTQ